MHLLLCSLPNTLYPTNVNAIKATVKFAMHAAAASGAPASNGNRSARTSASSLNVAFEKLHE